MTRTRIWIMAALLGAVMLAGGIGFAISQQTISSTTDVQIHAERQPNGDVHLALAYRSGEIISPGDDNIFRAASRRARTRPIAVTVEREVLMDSERTVSGTGDEVKSINLSPGLWLCSTKFNTVRVSRSSVADFSLILGTEEYGDPTVGSSYYGSGVVFLIRLGTGEGWRLDELEPNVDIPVTPIEARSGHRWTLYCHRIEHDWRWQ